ncbi:hypothetical protein FHL15_009740 [Xylaria flabelliformis]|uniref:BTB domain-containing protein n=1 Tax=Xylaria flabelliformis TaxID=2512241 RepID=A0A553HMW1_9PEZI|nr:hypothetical protein FHL15_009740 [Xylaria flabelliformis]
MAQSSRTLEEQLKATSGFSDLTVVCQGVEFAVHRFIVCARSQVLTAALVGNFSEAESKTINMDFDLDSVKRFLEFLYTGDYHEVPDPALALITSVPPTHDEGIQDTTVQQNIEQAIVLYDDEYDQNAAAEDYVLNLQLSNLTIDAVNKAAESWICRCRMSSVSDYYNVARLSEIALAKLEEGLRSEWCVKSFCALLLECLNEVSNRDTLCLLGKIAAEHYDELARFQLFEAGGPSERLAPFVLTSCIKRLNETRALRNEAEGRCEQLKHILDKKESELTQRSKNLEECESLIGNWSHCRNTNCGVEFRCFFDTKGPADSPTDGVAERDHRSTSQAQWASAPERIGYLRVIHDIAHSISSEGYTHTSLASIEPPPVLSLLTQPRFELAVSHRSPPRELVGDSREMEQQQVGGPKPKIKRRGHLVTDKWV